jgi:D-glycero-D-manno-heptose 1,7-bisphosphate phosphatase
MKKKAVFFDRDGIVNLRPVGDYIKDIHEFHFLPDFLELFKKVKSNDYLTILISNQQGVGKGQMSEDDLALLTEFMQNELLIHTGIKFDDIYYCTALAEENSPRRKPEPGMLLEAIEEWNINPAESWMIGDSESDIIAGKRAGVRTIFVTNEPVPADLNPDMVCKSLAEIEI